MNSFIQAQVAVRTDSEQIQKQLTRILESPVFAASPRMQRFLRFITETKLNGHSSGLKETSIGIAVFDREPGYDPQADAIVRVEARRLRSKLRRYYDELGHADNLVIELPLGTYVPEFISRPVDLSEKPPADPALPANLPLSLMWRWIVVASALLVLVVGVWLGWFWTKIHAPNRSRASIVPLTSYPGQEFDSQISPDGKQVAFVWDGNVGRYNLYTKLLQVGNPVRVTFDEGHDLHPTWSPDGQYLAFLRVSPSEKALMVVPALGGSVRKLAELTPSEVGTWRADATQMYGNPGPAWSPAGTFIAVTDYPSSSSGGGLTLFTPEGTRVRQITRPPAGIHDFSPVFSPNGKEVAFIRYTSAYTSDLYIIGTDGSGMRQLTFDRSDIQGISWLPDNRSLLFASNRGNGYAVWTIGTDGRSLALTPLNGYRITGPSVSRNGELLAYTDTMRNSNVWRVQRSVPGSRFGSRQVLIASSRQSFCAHYSPDGNKIVFISDRSGAFEIWVSKQDGSDPVQITNFHGPMVGSPRWSPDSRWIAFDARQDGHAAIFIVSASGGSVRRLNQTRFEERMPSWSEDGKWIYFCSNRGGTVQLWKEPVDGGQPVRISKRIAFTSTESMGGKTVYFTSLGAGLWQAPSNGGDESPVPELQGFHAGLYVAVKRHGIYLVDQEGSRNIVFFSFTTRKVETIAHMEKTMVIDTSSLDTSPDEREIIYSQLDAAGSDIMLARNWRATE